MENQGIRGRNRILPTLAPALSCTPERGNGRPCANALPHLETDTAAVTTPCSPSIRIFRGPPPAAARAPCALAIGNFDGVHRGHRALLARVAQAARERGLVPAAMTFEPHPREFFQPDAAPARVANLRDKVVGLRSAGIERVFVLHFNARLAQLPAERFLDEVLIADCAMRWLIVGNDFRFGTRRTGDIALLRARAPQRGFEVHALETVLHDGERISSSAVRAALIAGDLNRAQALLGHRYHISGRVLHGAKLGRQIGFPTINLRIPHKRPAASGIYAVLVHGLGAPRPGVASIGLRPTIDADGRWLLEVHLFDFQQEIYGRLVRVEFLQKLRDEAKFDTIVELTAAIERDAAHARAIIRGWTTTSA